MSQAAETASEYWAVDRSVEGTGARPRSWLQHKTMLAFVNRRVSGDPTVSTLAWFKQKYFPRPVDLALSLGCGFGGFERFGLEVGIAKKFIANDLSEGAIGKARETAAQAGMADRIEYSVANLDECRLPAATYDAIFALSAAHHVFQLENLFRQCRKALKPGGLLFLDEYVGPSRFQSAPEVTGLINRLRTIFPEKYRKSLFTDDGSLIHPYAPSPVEHFEKHDPSEAVRSGEIVNTLKLYFDILEFRPYGGAILHMLFSGIMGNFDENDETDVALLRTLATFEEVMENAGVIGSDFAAIVAKPKQVLSELSEYA
jgi:SAM-dependent methyltransferase